MIEVKDFSYAYRNDEPYILHNVNLKIKRGNFAALLGNNGTGKSTLIKCISRINRLTYTEGKILLDESNILDLSRKEIAQKISYVPQSNLTQGMGHKATVFETILLGRKPYLGWHVQQSDIEQVEKTISYFGLEAFANRSIVQLSGGERQKVFLARALAQEPEYLLLDEPINNLDLSSQYEFMNLLQKVCTEQKIGMLIILHDIDLALRYCNEFFLLKDTKTINIHDKEEFTEEIITEIFDIDVRFIEYEGQRLIMYN